MFMSHDHKSANVPRKERKRSDMLILIKAPKVKSRDAAPIDVFRNTKPVNMSRDIALGCRACEGNSTH